MAASSQRLVVPRHLRGLSLPWREINFERVPSFPDFPVISNSTGGVGDEEVQRSGVNSKCRDGVCSACCGVGTTMEVAGAECACGCSATCDRCQVPRHQ